ncbi:hypothetical protein [Streptomyces sp. NPDC001380]|uniref:hypothetical protein n=1 Tax=Streptomyces sp. NPDC001380 TaxID=3364566 RepID=UPI0036973D43
MVSSTAFWCTSSAAQVAGERRTYALGGRFTATAEAAMDWLYARLTAIAEQLDPPAPTTVRDWLGDPARYADGLRGLHAGRIVAVDLQQDEVCYTVGVRAVRCAAPPVSWPDPIPPLVPAALRPAVLPALLG